MNDANSQVTDVVAKGETEAQTEAQTEVQQNVQFRIASAFTGTNLIIGFVNTAKLDGTPENFRFQHALNFTSLEEALNQVEEVAKHIRQTQIAVAYNNGVNAGKQEAKAVEELRAVHPDPATHASESPSTFVPGYDSPLAAAVAATYETSAPSHAPACGGNNSSGCGGDSDSAG